MFFVYVIIFTVASVVAGIIYNEIKHKKLVNRLNDLKNNLDFALKDENTTADYKMHISKKILDEVKYLGKYGM